MSDGIDSQDRFTSLFDLDRGASFPSARVMAGIAIGDGFGWFIGGSLDIESPLGRDNMGYFSGSDPVFSFGADDVAVGVYPRFFTGFKF